MRVSRTSWIRAGIGLTALSALMLTGCAAVSDATASFSDDAAEESAAGTENEEAQEPDVTEEPEPEYDHRVSSGFSTESVAKELTTTEIVRPSKNTVTTATGTLTVNEVASLDEVTAATVGLEEFYDEDTDEVLPYGPAEGEVFRVFDVAFTSSVLSDEGTAPATDLSLKINGSQTHLSELDGGYTNRILMSVPKDGTAQVVVSSDGHNQFVDMLTGERVDDDIAATYYRDVQRQEPHHVFHIEPSEYNVVVDWSDLEDAVNSVDYDMQVDSVALASWQPENGWAPEGRAWAVIDWSYSAEETSTHYWDDMRIESLSFDVTIDSGSEQGAITTSVADSSTRLYGEDLRSYVSVPADATQLTLSIAGTTTMEERDTTTLADGVDKTATFSSDELVLDFPDANLPGASDEDPAASETEEPAEPEESAEPEETDTSKSDTSE